MAPDSGSARSSPSNGFATKLMIALGIVGLLTVSVLVALIVLRDSGTSIPGRLASIPARLDTVVERLPGALQRRMPELRSVGGYPGVRPALITLTLVAAGVGVVAGPKMGVGRWRLTVWLWAVLVPTAGTLTTPGGGSTLPTSFIFCSEGVWPRPDMLSTGAPAEVVSNIALLVPAGAVALLWPSGPKRLAALIVALATPAAIEVTQLLPALHRTCQGADVLNNSLGVLIGFAAAAGVEAVVVAWRRSRPGVIGEPLTRVPKWPH